MRIFLGKTLQALKQVYYSTDILFLVFLLLFLNVKLPIKLGALILIYSFRFNFNFGISFKKKSRLPLFYLLMVLLCGVELFLHFNFHSNYLILFTTCTCFWGVSFLVIHQVKLAIERQGLSKVKNALELFLIINIAVSFLNIFLIILETGSINPYTFEGLSFKYFVSTGDNIRGVMGDICTANMIINTFALFYFLYLTRYWLSFASLCVILLTTSNLGNMILTVFLILLFFTAGNKFHKSVVLVYLSVLIVFMVKISPANLDYFKGSYAKINKKKTTITDTLRPPKQKWPLNVDSLLLVYVSRRQAAADTNKTSEENGENGFDFTEMRKKIKNYKSAIQMTDSSFDLGEKKDHNRMMEFCKSLYHDSLVAADIPYMDAQGKKPGKLVSLAQTADNMTSGVTQFLFGEGPGNYSSKMAFRALGLNIDGSWPKAYTYHSEAFEEAHLKLWLFYRIQPLGEHSVINFPSSSVNQMFGEYGMIGVALFLVFYLWFFVRRFKFLTYGKILLPVLIVFLTTDYWFENLSVIIIFEIMILLDLAKKEVLPQP